MNLNKKILLICFSFPPFPGIGGRRWAKFAKHLANQGFKVYVLAAENTSDKISEWNNDVKHENIKVTTIPLGNSKVFSFNPESFIDKLKYKLLSLKAFFFIKGNKQDKIYFIKNKLLLLADELISHEKISTLIVSMPPYKLSYYLLPLKKKYPDVSFMVDYRDPWTDNKSYHGFATISEEDLKDEIVFEKEVLKAADVVFDVNLHSLQILKTKTDSKAAFIHLPNGFDEGDYRLAEGDIAATSVVRFIYTGSFYPNLIYLLQPIINALKKIEKSNSDLYRQISIGFYGNMDHEAIDLLKKANCSAITFHGNVPQTQVHDEISKADFCLLFSAPDHNHVFNTKFYEYLFFKKPILYFGKEGETSDYILKNKVGLCFRPESAENSFYEFLSSGKLKSTPYNTAVDISHFETNNISKILINTINA